MRAGSPWNWMRSPRHRDPARQRLVVREHLERQAVGAVDVLGIAGERHPAERPAAFAEQRPDVLGHEARDVVRALHARLLRLRADVVAVIERHGAGASAARASPRRARPSRRWTAAMYASGSRVAQRARLVERHAVRDIAVQRIVRAGLVGEDVGHEAAADQLGQHVGAVADQADRDAARGARRIASASSRVRAMRSQ